MSVKQFIEATCDRCWDSTEDRNGEHQSWAKLYCRQVNGSSYIGTADDKQVDICDKCLESLMKWWKEEENKP